MRWFNGPDESLLHVEYRGPGLPRQPIPDSALSHLNVSGGKTNCHGNGGSATNDDWHGGLAFPARTNA